MVKKKDDVSEVPEVPEVDGQMLRREEEEDLAKQGRAVPQVYGPAEAQEAAKKALDEALEDEKSSDKKS